MSGHFYGPECVLPFPAMPWEGSWSQLMMAFLSFCHMGCVQRALSEELLLEEIDTQLKDKQDRRERKKDAKLWHAGQTRNVCWIYWGDYYIPVMCGPTVWGWMNSSFQFLLLFLLFSAFSFLFYHSRIVLLLQIKRKCDLETKKGDVVATFILQHWHISIMKLHSSLIYSEDN